MVSILVDKKSSSKPGGVRAEICARVLGGYETGSKHAKRGKYLGSKIKYPHHPFSPMPIPASTPPTFRPLLGGLRPVCRGAIDRPRLDHGTNTSMRSIPQVARVQAPAMTGYMSNTSCREESVPTIQSKNVHGQDGIARGFFHSPIRATDFSPTPRWLGAVDIGQRVQLEIDQRRSCSRFEMTDESRAVLRIVWQTDRLRAFQQLRHPSSSRSDA